MVTERRPFYPCSHDGSCKDALCRCFRERIPCEKICACPKSCKRRYRGCSCAKDPRNPVCWRGQDKTRSKCECRRLNRECDADLCGSCGADEILDPHNRYNQEIGKDKCSNVAIQRNVPRKTFLGQSEVHGFGLYVGEKVKNLEYLGEYKGEVLSESEGRRRNAIYQYLKTNYIFTLNSVHEIDSTRAGNKFRFINNSSNDDTINCFPEVLLCNGVTRIGMFAGKNLNPGDELFFNY
ncbi:SET domain-containing protein, partial [Lindgomyces ingoldianus]